MIIKFIQFIFFFFIIPTVIIAQQNIRFQSQITNDTWAIRSTAKTNVSEYFSMFQKYLLTDTSHPMDQYLWLKYQLNNKTFINEEGYFNYKKDKIDLTIGRRYNPIGPGKMVGLFISPISPSLDQITLRIDKISNVFFRNSIIRLDNRSAMWDGKDNIAQRWYYLRSIGYNHKDILEINIIDAVIATGFNRGLEWYYLNPLSSLFMERKHQLHWTEGGDSTSVIGIGDNDNHFVGGNISLQLDYLKIYSEWFIDEWQLAKSSRDNVQTIFGTIFGINYKIGVYSTISIEYAIASPWLYINRALYGGLELHGLPIGLRSPQSNSLDFGLEMDILKNKKLLGQIHWEKRGEQTINTISNAWDNKIPLFNFTTSVPLEWKLTYINPNGKYLNLISIYHNWLGTNKTYLMVSKDWQLNF